MSKNSFSYSVRFPNNLSREYCDKELEYRDRQLAYEVFKAVSDGKFHSVRLHRDMRGDNIETEHRATMEIGGIEVKQYTPKYPKRLGFWERLKVLFTGDVPFRFDEK